MSTDLQIYDRIKTVSEIEQLGKVIAKSGMFGLDNESAGVVVLMTCMADRISLIGYQRTYDTVLGKPRKKAMAAHAEFRKRGGKVRWIKSGDDGVEASAEFEFEGQKTTYSYTMAQAKLAGLIKPGSAWTTAQGDMLRSKVIGKGLGMICPEIFADSDDAGEPELPVAELKLPQPKITVSGPEPTNTSGYNPFPPPKVTLGSPVIDVAPMRLQDMEAAAMASETEYQKKQNEVAESVAGLAPTQKPDHAPVTTVAPVDPLPTTGIPDELVAQVEQTIGEHGPKALAWFKSQTPPWLLPGQNLSHLTEGRARRIVKQGTAFVRAIGGVVA